MLIAYKRAQNKLRQKPRAGRVLSPPLMMQTQEISMMVALLGKFGYKIWLTTVFVNAKSAT
jgi:hypothetical protein